MQDGAIIKESFVQNERTSLNVMIEIIAIKLQQIRINYFKKKARKEKQAKRNKVPLLLGVLEQEKEDSR
ncbi:hypothetical protein CBW46_009325 [Paenibacillus xerothermodurans]|uniref:Uncharacterized protein n=1 Tax=Paenibacillus xerothermodurans TaxID=1977292 RepID=A0A2W1NB50_PAEXE|nr:hypothetical protein CBW46_009325 [Paenibacillus xerothermodurans]